MTQQEAKRWAKEHLGRDGDAWESGVDVKRGRFRVGLWSRLVGGRVAIGYGNSYEAAVAHALTKAETFGAGRAGGTDAAGASGPPDPAR